MAHDLDKYSELIYTINISFKFLNVFIRFYYVLTIKYNDK